MIINNMYNLSEIEGFNDLLKPENNTLNSKVLKLNRVQSKTYQSNYGIINYDKSMLCIDLIPSYGLCRSVIVNSENRVVSFAPPKSIPADLFIKMYPEPSSDIVAEEFVEGTMVNVFYDASIKVWEIATKNNVGATSRFYKTPNSKTFRQMFMEALEECKLEITKLNPELCYSFVLQHPENRIVVPFNKPNLYLVGMYKINHVNNNIAVEIYDKYYYAKYFRLELNTSVQFPKVYPFKNYSELIEKYGSMNTPYYVVGAMIHNKKTGERSKIRNPVYEQVRNLRGNQPKLQYHYLTLRKEGKVREFLNYYPESKRDFSTFRDQVHLFTETLYSNYVSCYIKKEKPLLEFPKQYRTHMFNIHQHFMNELREKKQFINSSFVQNYVNELHPSLLMYCLNYSLRKKTIDEKVLDSV